ncbi:MAG TPA: hypothetical protein VF662_02480 [Allosphingosinicella sp.]|jgi:hypothetical protein
MRLILPLLILAASCSAADAPPVRASAAEASIPFVGSNGISEWRRAGRGMVYIRSVGGEWYLARTMNACSALDSAISLGFVTSALGALDRHSSIRVEEQICPIESLVRSDAPPERSARRR